MDVGRESCDAVEDVVDCRGYIECVGVGFLGDRYAYPGLAVGAGDALGPPAVQGHVGYIRQPDDARLGSADDEVSHVLD